MEKLIRKPFIPSVALIVVDVLVLLGAIVINVLRENVVYTYTLETDHIVMHDPLGWYASVAAVALVLSAALTAVQIVINFLQARKKSSSDAEFKGDVVFLNSGSLVLLVISVALAMFAMWFSVPEKPVDQHFYGYGAGEVSVIIAEERYSDGTLAGKLYDTTHEDDISLLYSYELQKLSDGPERYTLTWAATDILMITYTDVTTVRSMQVNFNTLHAGHDHHE